MSTGTEKPPTLDELLNGVHCGAEAAHQPHWGRYVYPAGVGRVLCDGDTQHRTQQQERQANQPPGPPGPPNVIDWQAGAEPGQQSICQFCGHRHRHAVLCMADNPHLDCDCGPVTK